MRHVVALFGEAEKGPFKKPHYLRELPQLIDLFGQPPPETEGLFFAIQALLFQRELIYFRVEEEGYSHADYYNGFKFLEEVKMLHALCLPGVAEPALLNASDNICRVHKSCLITTQKDLYDYLTSTS
ncbi:MAG: hypothetical protein KGJ02_02275 [Verrucomicrobiota bacterium]|nr:hypothetical protein [Verrucomicrobiota bacterium]